MLVIKSPEIILDKFESQTWEILLPFNPTESAKTAIVVDYYLDAINLRRSWYEFNATFVLNVLHTEGNTFTLNNAFTK